MPDELIASCGTGTGSTGGSQGMALIGSSGFVGSTLRRQADFGSLFRSTTIGGVAGQHFDGVVCAAAPAQKWIANRDPAADRKHIDGLIAHLKGQEVPTAVYYPIPIHRQDVYSAYPAPGGLPVTDAKAKVVMSLPMHPYLTADDQDRVIAAIRAYVKRNG